MHKNRLKFAFQALLAAITLASTTTTCGEATKPIEGCPASPNCVSSNPLTDDDHHALPYRVDGSPAVAKDKLKKALLAEPGVSIVEDTGTLIRAQATSKLFHFVDDLVFQLDPENHLIQVRSASRVGYWDFGVNRRRIEAIRKKLAQ